MFDSFAALLLGARWFARRYLGNEINQQHRYPGYPDDLTEMNPPNTTEYASMLSRMVPPLLAKSPALPLKFLVVSANPYWDHAWASEVGKNVYAASNHKGYYNQPGGGAWTWNERTVTDCAKRPQREFVPILRDMKQELDATSQEIAISADEWGLGPVGVRASVWVMICAWGLSTDCTVYL